MKVLFYRYGSICEPDILSYFTALGITAIEEKTELYNKQFSSSPECINKISNLLTEHSPLFVFTINFFPVIAEVCHIHNVMYLCWTVDCPILELFHKAIQYPTNRIFLFDRAQYEYFKPYNPECIYYLPLAANVDRFNYAVQQITESDCQDYSADISFVGSLYSEKNPLKQLTDLSEYALGYIDSIIESTMQIYGYNFIEESLSDKFVEEFKKAGIVFPTNGLIENNEKHAIAHRYIGHAIAEAERIRTLNKLAEHFKVDLYTNSDTTSLQNVHTHAPIESLYGMPKVFHLSKINLNMTIKPIQTGLPLRIFDIMGCGGFLMTNYQAELTDFFEIGKDLEAYSSLDELIDKCNYYLHHEDERQKIALQGYRTVCDYHTYPHRLNEMIRCITSS